MLLNDSIKQSIYEIDALIDGYELGTLIIEDGQAFLLSNDVELLLNNSFQIEVIKSGTYIPVSFKDVINTVSTDGWYLYAGFQVRVKGNFM